MTHLMASFGNNIANFNKDTHSIGTDLLAHREDPGNLLPHLFATYYNCSLDNGPFKHYIEILENLYNCGTINLESKYLIDNAEVKYNNLKDNLKLKRSSKVEDPMGTQVSGCSHQY